MSLATRIPGALRRRQRRLYYERIRPEIPLSEIYDALVPGLGIDLQTPDGFQRLWSAHLSRTPTVLWSVTPPATPEMIARTAREEARVLAETFRVTPATDWHLEPFHEVAWPRVHVESFPYSVRGGDLTLLWRFNRMSYLIDDAAVWRARRDPAVADRVYALMESWARANPYLVGAQWVSSMETGHRLMAWSVSLAGMTDAASVRVLVCSPSRAAWGVAPFPRPLAAARPSRRLQPTIGAAAANSGQQALRR